MKFLIATFHAAFYVCARSFGGCLSRGRGFISALWALAFGPKVDRSTYLLRLHACRLCPIWNAQRETCGSPDSIDERTGYLKDGEPIPMGCFCHIPTKAQLQDATCWLHDAYPDGSPIGYAGWDRPSRTTV